MIPLKDENPTREFAAVTMLIIGICVAVYFVVQPTGRATFMEPDVGRNEQVEELRFSLENAAIPCEVIKGRPLTVEEVNDTFGAGDTTACEDDPTSPPLDRGKNVYLAVILSMFLHGSLLHLGGNMLFLWIFGNNIEDTRGRVQYVVFYLLAGLAATVAHIAIEPDSTVPVIGASGAIAGVMGAYLVLFPNAPIRSLIILGFFIFFRDISAKWLLGLWFVSQFFIGPNAGVAWMAHVGGFVFGVLAGLLWRATSPPPRPTADEVPWRY